jgi:hypothetical protein
MMRLGSLVIGVALLSGCSAVALKARYDATGELGHSAPAAASVKAEDVRVFYDSAPAGFSLKDNELKVEEGYQHKILGKVRVSSGGGSCDVQPYVTKKAILSALRERAAREGANAVIYTSSSVPDGIDSAYGSDGACSALATARRRGPDLGFGWAVVLQP